MENENIILSPKTQAARTMLDICFLLSDVINSLVMDAEVELNKVRCGLKHEDKRRFTMLCDAVKNVKHLSKMAAFKAYNSIDCEQFIDDSDAVKDLLLVIMNHLKNDKQIIKLSEWIKKVYKAKI